MQNQQDQNRTLLDAEAQQDDPQHADDRELEEGEDDEDGEGEGEGEGEGGEGDEDPEVVGQKGGIRRY